MGKDYRLEFADSIKHDDSSKNIMKSGSMVNGKPEQELEQYVGNRDKNVISEIEKQRISEKKTKVIHRLWRWVDGALKNVHEHKK